MTSPCSSVGEHLTGVRKPIPLSIGDSRLFLCRPIHDSQRAYMTHKFLCLGSIILWLLGVSKNVMVERNQACNCSVIAIANSPPPPTLPSQKKKKLWWGVLPTSLQSIYVTRDRVILKFEERVQIYMAVLNICYEIQNSDRNVVCFSKINRYGISFWLVLFKNMRNIRLLGVW